MAQSNTRQEARIISRFRDKARQAVRVCNYPGCTESAIRSHVLQAKGPLRDIAQNGKVVQLQDVDRSFEEGPYKLREVGLNEGHHVIRSRTFCNAHDTELFRSIEGADRGLGTRDGLLRHSYRTLVNEYNKMLCNLDWYRRILASSEISETSKEPYRERQIKYMSNAEYMRFEKVKIESDLHTGTHHFQACVITLPLFEFCCAVFYAFGVVGVMARLRKLFSRSADHLHVATHCITAFPHEGSLRVVLCTSSEKSSLGYMDLRTIEKMNHAQGLKFLSDVVVKHSETWFVSPRLHAEWKDSGRDKEILGWIRWFIEDKTNKLHSLNFNMFEHPTPLNIPKRPWE